MLCTVEAINQVESYQYDVLYFYDKKGRKLTQALSTRNTLFDHASRKSVRHNGIAVITVATDLPHEVDVKCQPLHQPLNQSIETLKSNDIEDNTHGKNTSAKPRKTT